MKLVLENYTTIENLEREAFKKPFESLEGLGCLPGGCEEQVRHRQA